MTRRMFEPTGRIDRLCYAALALTGPRVGLSGLNIEGLEFASVIMLAWSAITAYYTIEWAILSWRKFRNGRPL